MKIPISEKINEGRYDRKKISVRIMSMREDIWMRENIWMREDMRDNGSMTDYL